MTVTNVCLIHAEEVHVLSSVPISSVKIEDSSWRPKLETWNSVTLIDVLDKFEKAGAFRNFDRVAGLLEGKHEGPPWFDGLIYEIIRGASDLLMSFPNDKLEAMIDYNIDKSIGNFPALVQSL
ncbi:MAG: glycoside hydrolase family 127 protein [Thermoplasmata archaeon]|nr:MAG: glycoside hydrolase family 127 protein [Thermoplasmata archaeon]